MTATVTEALRPTAALQNQAMELISEIFERTVADARADGRDPAAAVATLRSGFETAVAMYADFAVNPELYGD